MEIFVNLAYQLLFTVGVLVLFGLLIAFSRRMFCRLTGRAGPRILLATGIVGTPVHELSHALMCILFGHRINEMKLFSLGGDGTLGYVTHSYNPRNIYHRVGCFFIGIAPIIGGSAAILLLFRLLVPNGYFAVSKLLLAPQGADLALDYLNRFLGVLGAVFSPEHTTNINWWIFLLLAFMIAGHMETSASDIRAGLGGFCVLAVILLALDTLLYLFAPAALEGLTALFMTSSVFTVGFLAIAGAFSLFLIAVALIARLILIPLR